MAFLDLLSKRRSTRVYVDRPIPKAAFMRLLSAAQGITDETGRRTAPSAHALHPLALYVVVRSVDSCEPGFFAVDPRTATLDRHGEAVAPGALLSAALGDDVWLERAGAVILVAADLETALNHFRDQQPDGLRGARYVDVETGAVVQNMALQAAEDGLGAVVVMGFNEERLRRVLPMLPRHSPVALFCVGMRASGDPI